MVSRGTKGNSGDTGLHRADGVRHTEVVYITRRTGDSDLAFTKATA